MKRLCTLFAALLLATTALYAGEEEITLNTPTGDIHGKLMLPDGGMPCFLGQHLQRCGLSDLCVYRPLRCYLPC